MSVIPARLVAAALADATGQPAGKVPQTVGDGTFEFIDTPGGGGGVSWQDEVLAAEGPGTDGCDEFTDTAIDAAWTQQTVSGSAAWTEGADALTCLFAGQSSGDAAAILRAVPAGFGVGSSIRTALRLLAPLQDFTMASLCLTNGTAAGSSVIPAMRFCGNNIQSENFLACRRGTLTDLQVSGATNAGVQVAAYPWLHMRLDYVSANTFRPYWSPVGIDGTWFDAGIGNVAFTMTPSHMGLYVSTFGGAHEAVASFDYFRVINP